MSAYRDEAPAWVREFFARPPLDFVQVQHPDGIVCYEHVTGRGLYVIVSGCVEGDGRRWIHVSCSRSDRLPSWSDLRKVKDAFIGRERKAIQVLPPASEYVNFHPYVLHLWCCLDGDGLPDFRKDGAI